MIKITIHGEPRALQRHRTAVMSGCQKQYDPQAKKKVITRSYLFAERQKVEWPYTGSKEKSGENVWTTAFDLTINFYCYRPPSMRSLAEEDLNKIPHTRKPDLDNLIKYILDCGNKILWHDDAEICKITAAKIWSKQPRTEIVWGGE